MNDTNGLTSENLMRTLPEALRGDQNTKALAQSAAAILIDRAQEVERLCIYAHIDTMPEKLLDILARDFKVDWWNPDYTLEEKRRTLKDSWKVHRMLGTKAAVETAISAIYPETKVIEWFEYGGSPYSFKLQIDATYENVDPERHKRVLERVEYYKNLRSNLEGVDYTANPDSSCTVYCGIAAAGIELSETKEVAVYGLE